MNSPRTLHPVPTHGPSQPNTVWITETIIGAALRIHRALGPGLLESAYEACLARELELMGLQVDRQKAVPLIYDSVKLDCGFRADLVVQGRVVVELKCKDQLQPVDFAQTLSHLRLLGLQVGLLINFHVVMLKDGIKRIVNNYKEEVDPLKSIETRRSRRTSAEDAE
jgi:GxxExxY protein